ncbi:hypothetical protein Tco_0528905 [Tanacetum coccineum]
MPIPNELITDDIRGADYYGAYLQKVAKHQRYLVGEEAKETTEATPPAKQAKAGKVVKKRTLKSSQQLVDEFVDEGIPLTEPGFGDLEAIRKGLWIDSLKVEGKGKEKVGAEQAARNSEEVLRSQKWCSRRRTRLDNPGIQDECQLDHKPGDSNISISQIWWHATTKPIEALQIRPQTLASPYCTRSLKIPKSGNQIITKNHDRFTCRCYEALEKSMARDNSDQLLSDLAEARKKKKKRQGSPKTPPGSPPHPLPPAGPFRTSGASGTSVSSQSPPPPPHLSNNQGGQSTSTAAPSSSKTVASA